MAVQGGLLIAEVEKYPWLWDARRLEYWLPSRKENFWKAIGASLNLMRAYTPCGGSATEDMAEESCEAHLDDDFLDRSLQPTDTCQVWLMLDGDGQLPSPSQLEPTRLVSPPQVAPVAAPTQATVSPAVPPHPPSRKPGSKTTTSERRAREDAALGEILSESTRQMANTCKRPHIDALSPDMALGFHFANELAALPPPLRVAGFFELIPNRESHASAHPDRSGCGGRRPLRTILGVVFLSEDAVRQVQATLVLSNGFLVQRKSLPKWKSTLEPQSHLNAACLAELVNSSQPTQCHLDAATDKLPFEVQKTLQH
ncbi:uncharacterized protein ISCGN_027301 [Ixodes scapularis]